MMKIITRLKTHSILLTLMVSLWAGIDVSAPALDIVISGGRVLDPETGLDAIRNVGIRGDKIIVISDKPLSAPTQIDATGLVVSPGFIDMHAHGQTILTEV